MPLDTISIQHIWTLEIKELKVESVTNTHVAVFWPLSGTYHINLKNGAMRAASIKARARNPICPWIAVDLPSLQSRVFEHLHPDKKASDEKRFHEHINNMPYQRPKLLRK